MPRKNASKARKAAAKGKPKAKKVAKKGKRSY